MNISEQLHNKLTQFIVENVQFTNWVKPSNEDLALEYKLEYTFKYLGDEIQGIMESLGIEVSDDIFPDVNDFINAAKKSKVVIVDKSTDDKIRYRSSCQSINCLKSMIRSYKSYPEYRNENTIDAMAQAFDENKPMKMPIVLQFSNDYFRVMGGNTRMDMAFIKGVNPKVILIDLRKFIKKV